MHTTKAIQLPSVAQTLPPEIRVLDSQRVIQKHISESDIKIAAQYCNITVQTAKRYRNNGRYPIGFLVELENATDIEIFSLLDDNVRYFSKHKKVKLPRYIDAELAYFIGYLQGDGCLMSDKKRIAFADEYHSQIVLINSITKDLFGIDGIIHAKNNDLSTKPCYHLTIGSKILNHFIHSAFSINRGIKTNLQIPQVIRKSPTLIPHYIAGLYDADGTLPKAPRECKQFFVDVTFKDENFIRQIHSALLALGIETYKPRCRVAKSPHSKFISKTWEIQIRRHADILRFLLEIPLRHPHKKKRAHSLLKILDP